ncbi:amino acid adenylation domain-containing protein [Lentzea tibetensis]|uniref:Amino acid adenylation domain-containing protein n=1 Tax=Lentzea tibetensis TaxID=2591470 RepID=A0A563ESI7_9PSEU|nr:non-ribosomal peptide synthetase [Lentzea tibetensis]TWP50636.1 amino acid adenylation domain-containing protein [Lentzea tibetensis]
MTSALQAQQAFRAHPAQEEYWTNRHREWVEPVVAVRDHLRGDAGEPVTLAADAGDAAALMRLTNGDPLLLRVVAAAVVAVVAARTTDRDDVVAFAPALAEKFGTPNRTVPLGIQVARDASARQLLGAVRAAFLETEPNLDVPVGVLLDRAGSRPTDFMSAVDGEIDGDDADRAGTPLLFTLITEPALRVALRYDPVLFTDATARRLLDAYRTVLHTITTRPAVTAAELLAPTEHELALLTGAFNDTEAEFPASRLLHSFLEERAREHPDHVAIADDGTTYAQLNSAANRLARTLRDRGVGAGSIVGVCVPRSGMMLTAIYAVLKAGGAYLPVDPTLPGNRIEYLLDHSGTELVLATPSTADVLAGAHVLDLSDMGNWDHDDTDLEPVTGPDDACYVIYTSGSTGRPKGVVVEHRAIVNRLWWMQRAYPLTPDDVILHKTPFTFDVSVWEIFWWSIAGATVATLPNGAERDPAQIAARIAECGATTMHFVPTMLHAFLTYNAGADLLSSLRTVFASGEALAVGHAGDFARILPDAQLVNLYGPTEAAVDVSFFDCDTVDATRSVPIGKPIDNIRLSVRTRNGALAPIGVPGELCIAGVGLARGYLHAPELTAERFVSFDGERNYRTGDLARWLPDGTIEYLGRLDTQVKIRGYRIELGEIEHVASKAAGVAECAVTAVTEGDDKALVAYVVAGPGFDESALRAALSAELPSYMVPQFVLTVPEIPANHNGKRDLSSLPRPSRQANEDFVEPATEVEQLLARVWSDVLGVERVGARDGFFTLGGDSILGIRVVAALREAGYELTVGDVFAHQRLSDLAAVVRKASAAVVVSEEDCWEWRASALQVGMIYHSSLETDVPVYHDIFRYEIAVERVDLAALVASWEWLARRHPVLRSRFDVDRMVVEDAPALPVEVLNGVDPATWAEQEKRLPVDPTIAPAYRVRFFVTGPDRVVLGLSFHHAILDGWSVATLVEEWCRAYADLLASRELDPPRSGAVLQQRYAELEVAAEADERQIEFWRAELADSQIPEVPRLASGGSAEVVVRGRDISARLMETLKQRAAEWSVPLKSVFVAAHLRVLGMVANQRDVVTGFVTNGRPEVDGAEHALGMFLNTLPFRLDLDPELTWRELAQRCFTQEQKLLPHRWFPLPAIQKLHGAPAFEVIFNFTNFHVHQGSAVTSVEYFEQTNAPLVVYVGSNSFTGKCQEPVWQCRIGHDPAKFTAEQVERYLGYYLGCFEALAASGDAPWVDTVPLSADEKAQLLPAIARPDAPQLDGCLSIGERFAAMVGKHGDRVAVSCGDRSLTYRELDRRAGVLAAQMGVQPGDLVGLALERDLEMVVCIVATIKAGAVYVPIDPGYPEDRIRTTVEDADVRLLIGTPEVCALFPERRTMDRIPEAGEELAAREVGPDAPAYVIYTSGSTGKPKGVQVTHGNVLRLFGQTDDWYGFTEQDTWTLFHSFAFDFSVWELWGALLYGGHLVVVPFWVSRSVDDFADLLVSQRVTVLNQTPSAFGQVKQAIMDRVGPAEVALRYVVFGGEALDFASLTDWFGHFGDARPRLVNMYGITETTVHVTYRPVCAADTTSPGSMIGEPIPDLGTYLIDERGNPVPLGTTGEIAVAGGGVALGYLNRPEETAKRFVSLDLGDGPARVYRSGDLARRLPGGDVEYLGRGDAQVKIQGYRIEIGDIEFALSSHPAIASVLVIAFTRRSGGKALAGYYVPAADVDQTALREYLGERLPSYMVPSFLVEVDAWPLTINGKIDRKALPDPEQQVAVSGTHAAPRNEVETAIAAIWQDVLGVPQVGIDDAYYELGGDSLQGIRLVGALRKAGFDVPLHELLRLQTIRALVAVVGTAEESADASEPFSLLSEPDRAALPSGVVDAYPATQLQLGMIFHTDLDPAQAAFHDLITYRIALPFDRAVLTGLVETMVERNEVLRTSFAVTGYSRPLQLVHERGEVNVSVHDLSHVDEAHQSALLDDWFDAEKSTGFLWSAPTQMRFFVHRTGSGSFALSVSFHHSIIDGWSFSGLMARLLEDYRRLLGDLPVTEVPEVPLAYRDYVQLELEAQESEEARAYWTGLLADAPYTKLPRLPEPGARWAETELTLDEEQYARLVEIAGRHKASVRHLCLAVHFRALSLISRMDDVTSGVFGHGRPEHEDAERMVGLFLNIVPLRARVSGRWEELIAEIVRLDHEHIPHRRFSHASIQRAMGGGRLVETAFNFVNFSAYSDQLGEQVISGLKWFEHSDFALLVTFNADLFSQKLNVTFNAAARVLGADAVRTVASVYEAVLSDLVVDDLLAALPPAPDGQPDGYDRIGAGQARIDRALLRSLIDELSTDGVVDSLTAVRVMHEARSRFGVSVPLQAILMER